MESTVKQNIGLQRIGSQRTLLRRSALQRTGGQTGSVALIVIAVIAVVGLVVSYYFLGKVRRLAEQQDSVVEAYGEVPEFRFVDHTGAPFGRDEMLGKVSLVSFQFTRCPGVCKTMSTRLGKIYATLDERPALQIVTITVDPDYDTPAVLTAYAKEQGVTDRGWIFLNGPIEDVVTLCEEGFMMPADALPGGHSPRFAVVDRDGVIRAYFDSTIDEEMAALDALLDELDLSLNPN